MFRLKNPSLKPYFFLRVRAFLKTLTLMIS
jgi:hypothetical protein